MNSAPQTGNPIRVLVVDDHQIVALGLVALLEDDQSCEVVAVVASGAEALEAVTKYQPQVVLMDYRLPDGTGADATRAIRALNAPPGVVMVTSVADRHVMAQALDAGCCGFLSKNADRRDLVAAVVAAARNESFFTKDVLTHLVHLKRFDDVDSTELTEREIEVLQETANGLTPEQIAEQLYLSSHTVKNHLRHTMAKLDSHTKLDAVVKAARARVISLD